MSNNITPYQFPNIPNQNMRPEHTLTFTWAQFCQQMDGCILFGRLLAYQEMGVEPPKSLITQLEAKRLQLELPR